MSTFNITRKVSAPIEKVFDAFEDVDRLAAWWGPAGFTNTFETFGFRPGGKWSFTMHGPDGKNYPNEIVVTDIERPTRIAIDHVSPPRYFLTITLEPTDDGGTLIGWDQEFENPETGRRMEKIAAGANDQLLDRLTAEVLRGV
jgi:uncharacterized protein YndB with AHSA1/START domain